MSNNFASFLIESENRAEELADLEKQKHNLLDRIAKGGGYNPYWYEDKKELEAEIKKIDRSIHILTAVKKEIKHPFKIGILAQDNFKDVNFVIDRYQHLSANKKDIAELWVLESELANRLEDVIKDKELDIALKIEHAFPDKRTAIGRMIDDCSAFIKILPKDFSKIDFKFTNEYLTGLLYPRNSNKPIRNYKI